MVGEDTHLEVVIDKALVQRAQHGLKGDVVAAVVKDVAQALDLLGAVAQDEQAVAAGEEVAERLPDEVKVLVVDALWLEVQRQVLHAALGHCLALGEVDAPQLVQAADEQVGVHHLASRLGVALVGDEGAHRHAFGSNLADA